MRSLDKLVHVYFVLHPHAVILDWAGPAEALRIANQKLAAQGKPAAFEMHFVGPQASSVSSVGAAIANIAPLPRTLPASVSTFTWLYLLGSPSAVFKPNEVHTRATIDWLAGLPRFKAPNLLVTVCAGALLAAHAGLLNHTRATTHHQTLDELQRIAPMCDVVANRIFMQDGCVYSSAGITAGIDLTLHLIEQHCGADVAAWVAQTMVLPLRRGPHDPEVSPFLQHRNHLHPAVHRVQDAVNDAPRTDWTLPRMAQIAFVTPRHLGRLFAEHAHTTPQDYVRNIRLALAEQALKMGKNVQQAADAAGFRSDTQLRRAWRAAGKIGTPSAYVLAPKFTSKSL